MLSTLYDPAAFEQDAVAFRLPVGLWLRCFLRPTPNPTPNATARMTMAPVMIHKSFDRRVVGNQEDLAGFLPSIFFFGCF